MCIGLVCLLFVYLTKVYSLKSFGFHCYCVFESVKNFISFVVLLL